MNITVDTNNPSWTQFEKDEWAKADKDHYGVVGEWDKKHFFLEAKENGEVVGTLRLELTAGVAYIDSFIVAKDKRGKGIGKALVRRAEEIAREYRAHKIHLNTGKDWEARKVYEKLGYEKAGNFPDHYYHIDFIEMHKFLK